MLGQRMYTLRKKRKIFSSMKLFTRYSLYFINYEKNYTQLFSKLNRVAFLANLKILATCDSYRFNFARLEQSQNT